MSARCESASDTGTALHGSQPSGIQLVIPRSQASYTCNRGSRRGAYCHRADQAHCSASKKSAWAARGLGDPYGTHRRCGSDHSGDRTGDRRGRGCVGVGLDGREDGTRRSAFDEGLGTTVTDASGNGNNGTITNATWVTTGKYGDALKVNGSNALVTIPDTASLHLSTGMTLEAWVNPSTVNANWRDVIYKGNDNLYLEATSSNGSVPDRYRDADRCVRSRAPMSVAATKPGNTRIK